MNAKLFKQTLLDRLYAPYKNCTMCPLGTLGRKQVVFGEGDPSATLMFIGEGPGRDEDEQGRPFVGRSGKLLTRTLNSLNVERESVFITNIVKCRPPNNRAPSPQESNMCKSLLLDKQIKIIQPKIICTLGSSSLKGLINKEVKITKVRGKELKEGELTIIPTFHPAYILRNPRKLETFASDIKLAIFKSKK